MVVTINRNLTTVAENCRLLYTINHALFTVFNVPDKNMSDKVIILCTLCTK
jgi:hypothetical protein